MLGYLYVGASQSLGTAFWLNLPNHTITLKKIGFWIRIFDYRRVADWVLSRRDQLIVRSLSCLIPKIPLQEPRDIIRPYALEDLRNCHRLLRTIAAQSDLGLLWSKDRLRRQLQQNNFPCTIIAKMEDSVSGFMNYYNLDILGRSSIKTSIIDIACFGELNAKESKTLLQSVLEKCNSDGAAAVLLLRSVCYPLRSLLACGFFPYPSEFLLTAIRMNPKFNFPPIKKVFVTWK